jgi:hypothetical protein
VLTQPYDFLPLLLLLLCTLLFCLVFLPPVCPPTQAAAEAVGKKLAELCKEKQISKVAFDRGGYMYHGRVQALADAAREGGLDF